MNRILRRMLCGERGASIVEMTLVIGFLLLLAAGVADLGRVFHSYIVITNASREGVRYASHFPSRADEARIKAAAIQEAADSGVALSPADITIPRLDRSPGEPIEVWVEYHVPTIMGGILGTGDLTLRSRTAMVVFGRDVAP